MGVAAVVGIGVTAGCGGVCMGVAVGVSVGVELMLGTPSMGLANVGSSPSPQPTATSGQCTHKDDTGQMQHEDGHPWIVCLLLL